MPLAVLRNTDVQHSASLAVLPLLPSNAVPPSLDSCMWAAVKQCIHTQHIFMICPEYTVFSMLAQCARCVVYTDRIELHFSAGLIRKGSSCLVRKLAVRELVYPQIHNIIKNTVTLLGLDRYRDGTRYPILSAAAAPIPMPIPILEMTSHIAWGMHMLHTLCTAYVRFKT